jgi:hypothetical protein
MDGGWPSTQASLDPGGPTLIWGNYVFRRGASAEELWDEMFGARAKDGRPIHLLYVAGRGFDLRANITMDRFIERLRSSSCPVGSAKLLLVGFSGYQLADELRQQTATNAAALTATFGQIGEVESVAVGRTAEGEDDISTAVALRRAADDVLAHVTGCTDVVLDVSSLPRISYLTLLLSLLAKLIPNISAQNAAYASGITLHVLVGEDAVLDAEISSEDPANELVLIPGYAEAMQAEALQDSDLVWFPLLGENRVAQLRKVETSIPSWAEICPILPHPSRDPRRGDKLLVEFSEVLIAKRETPLSNILYVHEANPFEAYRQLLEAMRRYQKTMEVVGGCRLVVTPLASKLVTIGSALACFEMKFASGNGGSRVAIPYAEPKRYVASLEALKRSRPDISALVLTGESYLP